MGRRLGGAAAGGVGQSTKGPPLGGPDLGLGSERAATLRPTQSQQGRISFMETHRQRARDAWSVTTSRGLSFATVRWPGGLAGLCHSRVPRLVLRGHGWAFRGGRLVFLFFARGVLRPLCTMRSHPPRRARRPPSWLRSPMHRPQKSRGEKTSEHKLACLSQRSVQNL